MKDGGYAPGNFVTKSIVNFHCYFENTHIHLLTITQFTPLPYNAYKMDLAEFLC